MPPDLVLLLVALAALLHAAPARNVTVSWGLDVSRASVSVYAGDRVTWVLDQSTHTHTLTSAAITTALGNDFGGTFTANQTFSLTVNIAPGTYMYYCKLHPTLMVAYLTVLASGNATLPLAGF